ncbi:hypothetical protein [Stenotrophomonas sp.]|uniref:hypothetical protein n=1 Tax=Stenotrophomonas sp. TaxID=69392 RepID=UPI00289E9D95|nr:hypothetical protein [Stenotrophomonas sp.]
MALAACGDEQVSPSDAFVLPEQELATLEASAGKGDVDAVTRLIAHYEALSGSDDLAEKWKARARDLGDSKQLYYYAASTYTAAVREEDSVKRHEMLVEALAAARRSNESASSPSAKKLILDVKREMHAD